ncbi:MAG: YtxH domain-containing protein [Gemmatirosa sp.]|nr:YtxH domain-containing protein [Gemmatirosa sp.]
MHAPHGSAPGPRPDAAAGTQAGRAAAAGTPPDADRPANGRATATEPRADGRFALPRLTLRRGGDAERPARSAPAAAPAAAPDAGTDDESEADWRAVGLFGAGLVLGALIGAGTALLLAPATGFETRTRLVRRARSAGEQAADRLDDLNDRVRRGAKRSRRKLERKLTLSRWRAQDAWERKRYGR